MSQIKNFLMLDNIDPIAIAEDNGFEASDAIAASFEINNLKKNIMKDRNDTYHGILYSDFMRIVLAYGFKIVYEEEFLSSYEKVRNDIFNIMFHDDGILLISETYGDRLNSCHIYYNISPIVDINSWCKQRVTESGQYNEDHSWSGYHDVREGLILKIDRMKTYGDFNNPWKYQQYLQFLNYKEWNEMTDFFGNYVIDITRRKFNKLPENVKRCIGNI